MPRETFVSHLFYFSECELVKFKKKQMLKEAFILHLFYFNLKRAEDFT